MLLVVLHAQNKMELWLSRTERSSYLFTIFKPVSINDRLEIDSKEPFGEAFFLDHSVAAFIGKILKPHETMRVELCIKQTGEIEKIEGR